jgi:3,2-trans-enoyl-CoA isomerase
MRTFLKPFRNCPRRFLARSASHDGSLPVSTGLESLIEVHEHATLPGIYTIGMRSPPVNVLSRELLQQLTATLRMLAAASDAGQDSEFDIASLAKEDKGTAITGSSSLLGASHQLRNRNKPRAVVLTSFVPGCFSGGLDLDVLAPQDEALLTPQSFGSYWFAFQDTWLQLQRLPIPIIAAINGNAPAAGCILATACDARVMVRNAGPSTKFRRATIGITAARAGFAAPSWVVADFRRVVDGAQAERLLCSGDTIDADHAHRIGLVDVVVDRVGAEEETWAEGDPRFDAAADVTLRAAALAMAVEYAAVPSFAFWLTKEPFRRKVLESLPDYDEARAADAREFYLRITSPATRQRLLQYRQSVSKK